MIIPLRKLHLTFKELSAESVAARRHATGFEGVPVFNANEDARYLVVSQMSGTDQIQRFRIFVTWSDRAKCGELLCFVSHGRREVFESALDQFRISMNFLNPSRGAARIFHVKFDGN